MKKTYIIIIILFVLFGLAAFFYQSKETTIITDDTTQSATTTTTAPVQPTQEYPYDKLSVADKAVIDRYTEKYSDVYTPILESYNNNASQAKSTILIKYRDDKTVAFAVLNGKAGLDISIYDVNTLNRLDKNPLGMTLFGNFVETDNYIVVVYDTLILYYKKGSTDIVTITKSELNPRTETYVKLGGFGSTYDFTFDEGTKTITASIFKPENREGKENAKIRTAIYKID